MSQVKIEVEFWQGTQKTMFKRQFSITYLSLSLVSVIQ